MLDAEPAFGFAPPSGRLRGVLFACVAGMFLGALKVTMRRGLARVPDVDAGSAVIATAAVILVAGGAVTLGTDFLPGELWPFLLLETCVPGLSQLLVVRAVQAAGAARAGILFGMAPLFSALIAIGAFGEPLRWALAVGTVLVVAGGVALAWEPEHPADYRAYGAALAVTVAVAFGMRDNVARVVSEDVARGPARADDCAHARRVDDPPGESLAAVVGAFSAAGRVYAIREYGTPSESRWAARCGSCGADIATASRST
jgi:drug/metabolite transporter (DMT)-like permease